GQDLSLVVVDADYGFGNGRLIPAGPLRERVANGLARADCVVLIAGDGTCARHRLADIDCPILHAALTPVDGARFGTRRVLSFAGIARPAKFFASLRGCGAELVAERAFPDHHRYRDSELSALKCE